MEKIIFDNKTYIWKTKLNVSSYKENLIKLIVDLFNKNDAKYDTITIIDNTNNIDFIGDLKIETPIYDICQKAIDICKKIYNDECSNQYNKINVEVWINKIQSKNPIQMNFYNGILYDMYHTHTDINEKNGSFIPIYTFVYYIQMPEIMENKEGVLYLKGSDINHWIRPEEDDLIVMPADLPHAPKAAPKASKDRIVLAGNINFEIVKKSKSLV